MFAVCHICIQDSIFKMSSESSADDYAINHRISYYLELLIIINGSFPDGHQAITWIGVH